MLINKYKIEGLIASGGFGSIHTGRHTRTNERVAIKIEQRGETNSLKHEARIYNFLKDVGGVPKLKWFGTDAENMYIILPLLGENLKHHVPVSASDPGHLTTIGVEMLRIIKDVHTMQIVHCDIKPENFVFDREKQTLYLIDFGFARQCKPASTKVRACIGTPNYMSREVHNCYSPEYIDDVESLLYALLFISQRDLPWANKQFTNDEIREEKTKLILATHNTAIPGSLAGLLDIVATTKRGSLPNYNLFLQ